MVFFLLKLKLQNIGFFIEIHASKQRCKLLKQKPQISIVTIENLRGQYQDIDPIQYPMLRDRFRSIPWQTRTYLRTWQHQMTTMKQPFQCNLQPEIQEPHRTTHTDTTTRCKTHRRNNSRTKRPQPHPSHTRGTFHRRLQPLYTEKHKVWCSGFLPTT